MTYAFSKSTESFVAAEPRAVFEILDDPRRLGRHMEKPSAMMLGGSMRYLLDDMGGREVGSVIRVEGGLRFTPENTSLTFPSWEGAASILPDILGQP